MSVAHILPKAISIAACSYIGAAISTHYSDSDAAVSKEDRFLGTELQLCVAITLSFSSISCGTAAIAKGNENSKALL